MADKKAENEVRTGANKNLHEKDGEKSSACAGYKRLWRINRQKAKDVASRD